MNTATTSRAPYRPRPLTADQQHKIDRAHARMARKQLIRSIRTGLEGLVAGCERELEMRRRTACGGDMSPRHIETLTLRENVEALLRVLGHDH